MITEMRLGIKSAVVEVPKNAQEIFFRLRINRKLPDTALLYYWAPADAAIIDRRQLWACIEGALDCTRGRCKPWVHFTKNGCVHFCQTGQFTGKGRLLFQVALQDVAAAKAR